MRGKSSSNPFFLPNALRKKKKESDDLFTKKINNNMGYVFTI
jgi:hypothetical protein